MDVPSTRVARSDTSRQAPRRTEDKVEKSRYDPPQNVTDPLQFGVDTAMGGLIWVGFALWLLGRQDEAIEKNPEALDIAERQGLPFPIAYGHSLSAWFHQYRGDADEVLRHADASIQISREHDFGLLLPVGLMFRGWALTALGRIAECVPGSPLPWSSTAAPVPSSICRT